MIKKYFPIIFLFFSYVCNASSFLVVNANGYTFDTQRQLKQFNTLYVKDGKVVEFGTQKLEQAYPQVKKVDVKGKTVLPGLTDAHGHVMGLGYSLLSLDVRGTKSIEQAQQKIKDYSTENPGDSWIRGRGWNQVLWAGKKFPNAQDIDRVVSDRPVWLRRIDGHAGWANSKALALAGIDRHTLSPAGGEIKKDHQGNPTGILIDNAMALLENKIPDYTPGEMEKALNTVSEHLLKLGVTSVHDAGIGFSTYQFYRDLADKQLLKLRLYAMLSGSSRQLKPMLKQGYITRSDDFLSIRSVKLYGDGALGSRGAALLKPYSDQPEHTGLLITQPEQLSKLYQTILNHQFQINIHGIGDRGVRMALDEFARVLAVKPELKKLRHRVEHAQVVALEDIPRFKALGIIPSMQPTHATSDMNMAQSRIGKQRLKGAYAWRSFLSQGSIIAAGSDFPVELANPFYGIHAAVTRQDRKNQPTGGWRANQSMTVEEAVRAFTIDAAYAAHQENTLGGLTPGKWADFIVVDQDIFTIKQEKLWMTKVKQTWIAGHRVYAN